MVNEQVIERLRRGDWSVEFKTEQEGNLILQACDKTGITWVNGEKATDWKPFGLYPLYIIFYKYHHGITYSVDPVDDEKEIQNITDWFFNTANGIKQ